VQFNIVDLGISEDLIQQLSKQQRRRKEIEGRGFSKRFSWRLEDLRMSEDQLNNNLDLVSGRESLELIKTVGTGTFARVSLCRQKASSKFFALKIISLQDTIRLKQVEHVKNEKSILKTIQHPFLISLTDSWKDSRFLYLLFPYIPGGELFSYLRNAGRFSPSTTLFYSAEIVSALEYLHSLSVAYRDLKPENLLLDRQGHIVITDFGFAKVR